MWKWNVHKYSYPRSPRDSCNTVLLEPLAVFKLISVVLEPDSIFHFP